MLHSKEGGVGHEPVHGFMGAQVLGFRFLGSLVQFLGSF